jgi:hypothetical protein
VLSQSKTRSVVGRSPVFRALSPGAIFAISLGICAGGSGWVFAQTGDVCPSDLKSDSLEEFAKKCAAAVGEDVPAFDCDAGTEVPQTHLAGGLCDRPNVLNGVCDPGSRFQVLKETNDVAIVGHCRKKGNADHEYGDIAAIQYNKKNGAICFYQALAGDPPSTGALPAKVTAPSDGNGPGKFPWLDPSSTASINCVRCHDNGPFIRSEYLAQLRNEPKNRLPGTNPGPGPWDQQFTWNQTLPLSFVGNDFQSWKTYAVSITGAGSGCLGCHRLGFSQSSGSFNIGDGTAQNFALIATAMTQASKNPNSPDSPIWMTPGQIFYSAANDTEAHGAAACAAAIANHLNDPNNNPPPPPGCQYAQFGRGNECSGPPIQVVVNGATQSNPTGGRTDVTVPLGSCTDPSQCPPGFCYFRTLHGPLWQTTPFSVPIADAAYRGSFLRIFGENGLWKFRAFSDTTGLPPNAPPGGTVECTVYNEILAIPNVSTCFANPFSIVDKDGTTQSSSVNVTAPGATTADVLSGTIGNIAQANFNVTGGETPDTLRLLEAGGTASLIQFHDLKPPPPLKIGPLRGESWTNGCGAWTPNFLAKDVHSTSDVQLLDPAQTANARCFITGVTGAWSSTRNNATIQPFAEIYLGASNEARLKVSPVNAVDQVGAYASCIQLK